MPDNFIKTLDNLFPDFSLKPVDLKYKDAAKKHLDNLTKPKGSLGRLEDIATRLYIIYGGNVPLSIDPVIMFTVAADHGIAKQKVSPFPQVVTRQMVQNFLNNGAAVNALCNTYQISLKIIDAGCAGDKFPAHPMLMDRRIANATKDFSKSTAMTEEQCRQAILEGFRTGYQIAKNYSCMCLGEMGIGNSSSATALFCAYLGLDPDNITGPGAGANEEMIRYKKEVIREALIRHKEIVASHNPVSILAAFGGFEIAMLAGLMLSCAALSIPFLVDGFICTAAYLAASLLYPPISGYAFFSHSSAEPGYNLVISSFPEKPNPLLKMDMRLGEGTGCALAVPILRGACAIYNSMATLSEAHVSATEEDRID